jgi:hypothetical protein
MGQFDSGVIIGTKAWLMGKIDPLLVLSGDEFKLDFVISFSCGFMKSRAYKQRR